MFFSILLYSVSCLVLFPSVHFCISVLYIVRFHYFSSKYFARKKNTKRYRKQQANVMRARNGTEYTSELNTKEPARILNFAEHSHACSGQLTPEAHIPGSEFLILLLDHYAFKHRVPLRRTSSAALRPFVIISGRSLLKKT